jgi:hypothetical protein
MEYPCAINARRLVDSLSLSENDWRQQNTLAIVGALMNTAEPFQFSRTVHVSECTTCGTSAGPKARSFIDDRMAKTPVLSAVVQLDSLFPGRACDIADAGAKLTQAAHYEPICPRCSRVLGPVAADGQWSWVAPALVVASATGFNAIPEFVSLGPLGKYVTAGALCVRVTAPRTRAAAAAAAVPHGFGCVRAKDGWTKFDGGAALHVASINPAEVRMVSLRRVSQQVPPATATRPRPYHSPLDAATVPQTRLATWSCRGLNATTIPQLDAMWCEHQPDVVALQEFHVLTDEAQRLLAERGLAVLHRPRPSQPHRGGGGASIIYDPARHVAEHIHIDDSNSEAIATRLTNLATGASTRLASVSAPPAPGALKSALLHAHVQRLFEAGVDVLLGDLQATSTTGRDSALLKGAASAGYTVVGPDEFTSHGCTTIGVAVLAPHMALRSAWIAGRNKDHPIALYDVASDAAPVVTQHETSPRLPDASGDETLVAIERALRRPLSAASPLLQ